MVLGKMIMGVLHNDVSQVRVVIVSQIANMKLGAR
jgi:hypothetical protein